MHIFLAPATLLAAMAGLSACVPPPGSVTAVAPGQEAPIQRAAASGQRQKVGFAALVEPDCTPAGQVAPRLVSAATHGTVEFTPMNDFAFFQAPNPRAKCNDRRVSGVGLFYTSEPGFRGLDTFTYTYLTSEGFRRVWRYQVNVE